MTGLFQCKVNDGPQIGFRRLIYGHFYLWLKGFCYNEQPCDP